MGMVCDAVRGRAEQVVAEEVAAVADHDQVVSVGYRVVGDHLGGVPGHQIGLELDAPVVRLRGGVVEDALEELVLLSLDLVDLSERGRVCRQLALDGQRGELCPRVEQMDSAQSSALVAPADPSSATSALVNSYGLMLALLPS
jgi:hypothetical protein